MPRTLEMTYVPSQKRWTKFYRGKTYSVSCKQLGCQPGKEASWMAANVWWEKKKAELDAAEKVASFDPLAVAAQRVKGALEGVNVEELRALIERADAAKVILATLEDTKDRAGEINPYVVGLELRQGLLTASKAKLAPGVVEDMTVAAQVEG